MPRHHHQHHPLADWKDPQRRRPFVNPSCRYDDFRGPLVTKVPRNGVDLGKELRITALDLRDPRFEPTGLPQNEVQPSREGSQPLAQSATPQYRRVSRGWYPSIDAINHPGCSPAATRIQEAPSKHSESKTGVDSASGTPRWSPGCANDRSNLVARVSRRAKPCLPLPRAGVGSN